VVGGAEAGGCTIGLEPSTVGQLQEFGGAVSSCGVGDERRVVGEISRGSPGGRFWGRD
jgi:hypothetical protein